MAPELTAEELGAAMDGCVAEVLWEVACDAPPVDAFAVAYALGVVVAEDANQASRARYARWADTNSSGDTRVILVRPEDRPERRQWAVAHEIGELTAHRVFYRLGVLPTDVAPTDRESIANGLASRLLLPTAWLRRDGAELDWDLLDLKQVYATASHELIARRWLEACRMPVVVTVMDHAEVSWRRTNFAGVRPPLFLAEREAWRECHESGLAVEFASRQASVERARCWPVHEPAWRREVLLTELPEVDGWDL
ncbi:MAG: ImmA/IrrE family metallo-endopeptidase [Planctomycetota bacterium]